MLALLAATALTTGTALVSTAQAAPEAAATATAALAPADPFAQAVAARTVAEYARRQKDPVAMMTAARMLGEIPFAGADAAADAAFTPAGLFAEAKALAKGDTMLLAQIRVAESTATRGVSSSAFGRGLVRNVQVVNPRGAYQFAVNAKGGETLRIGAIGDVGTNLTMRLKDASGRTVCLDDQGDYAPVCQLKPKAAGNYQVEITNRSPARSRTVILSN